MKLKSLILAVLAVAFVAQAEAQQHPKREFRGAWIHTVHQKQYAEMTSEQTQAYLVNMVDSLQLAGINAILWQIRPSADALYPSELEPWSRYLTGTAGKAPDPMWDPLQFMIDECHKRNIELHAWINPYRVTTVKTDELPENHIYYKHPEWFVRYGQQIL
ncbi:MAG: family 10 glycosylhydrolase, partial [Rikenellaceae bacterium]|nr:family 10 glycosylhydrolase [Rikenellaceae bacterium]